MPGCLGGAELPAEVSLAAVQSLEDDSREIAPGVFGIPDVGDANGQPASVCFGDKAKPIAETGAGFFFVWLGAPYLFSIVHADKQACYAKAN